MDKMDHLRQALAQSLGVAAPEPVPSPLPDPHVSAWAGRLRAAGERLDGREGLPHLEQRARSTAKAWKSAGRAREAAALLAELDEFLRAREKKAWELVKARFAELGLPERAYRALKQEGVSPERALARLAGEAGESLRGAGAARVRDAIVKKL
jgi:hypothetical protein